MKLKKRVKKIFQLVIICSLIAYLSFVIIWAQDQDSKVVCKGVKVEIINAEDSTIFLTPTGIINDIKALKLDPTGKLISSINTHKIETTLNKLDYFEDVQCVIDNNSNLKIEVKQIMPIMRVFENDKSFYINKDGKRMKANARYHINVPIVTGNFNDAFKPIDILPLLEYIGDDEVLNSYITMIEAKDKDNLYIIPNIDGHIVNIGNVENLESKFAKIKMMYSEVLPIKGWYTYDTISVKWDYQVVATRRNKTVATKMEFDAQDDEPDTDVATMETDSPPISAEQKTIKSVSNNSSTKPKEEKKIEKKKENLEKKKPSEASKPKKEKEKKSIKAKTDKLTKDAFTKRASTKTSEKNKTI